MSKLLKAVLIGAYGALLIQFLRTFTMDRYERLIEIKYVFRLPGQTKKLQRAWKQNKNDTEMTFDFKKPIRLPTDFKFILKFTKVFYEDKSETYGRGQLPFIEDRCKYTNCFFTENKFFLSDVRYYDAIVFDLESIWEPLPMFRSTHQKYIFTASESHEYNPICHPGMDNFYNWTWTYRLNSDIRWSYLLIYDLNYTLIGPKLNMTWIDPMDPTPGGVIAKLAKKKKMAAWFVSDCNTKNNRMNISLQIQKHLNKFGFKLDIYGECGSFTCRKDQMNECLERLQKEYYFYLSFESANSEDYVTEKLLYPLQHYTVPVVYGGADYSRFLPPGSYIDAGQLQPYVVASIMIEAVTGNKQKYYDFFKWHNHYIYKNTDDVSDICDLCELLNEKPETSIVKDFRQWWYPNYRNECGANEMERAVEDLEFERPKIKKNPLPAHLNRNKRTGSDMSAETGTDIKENELSHFGL